MTLYLIASAFFSDQKVAFFGKGLYCRFQEGTPLATLWQHSAWDALRSSDVDRPAAAVLKAVQVRSDRHQLPALLGFQHVGIHDAERLLDRCNPAASELQGKSFGLSASARTVLPRWVRRT